MIGAAGDATNDLQGEASASGPEETEKVAGCGAKIVDNTGQPNSPAGGETALLSDLPGPKNGYSVEVLWKVIPLSGRLFFFPHKAPHLAQPVLRPPKLLLRGEVFLEFAAK